MRRAGITKPASCHTFRNSFTTHLFGSAQGRLCWKAAATSEPCTQLPLEQHRSVSSDSALGHKDVSTTQIYTHVLNRPGLAVRSPLDSQMPSAIAVKTPSRRLLRLGPHSAYTHVLNRPGLAVHSPLDAP
jgi:hypothetical protein